MTVNFISFCNQASSKPRAGKTKHELFNDPIFISSREIKTNTMARMSAAITLPVSFIKYQTITLRLIRAICMHNFCEKSMSISYSLSPVKLTTYSSLSPSKPGFILRSPTKEALATLMASPRFYISHICLHHCP
jgi:hypothetical protein